MSHLLFVNHTRQLHGSEQVLLHVLRAARADGHRITVVLPSHVPSGGLDQEVEPLADRILYLPYRPVGISLLRSLLVLLYNIYAWRRAVRYIRREGVEAVYSNTSVTVLGLWAARSTHLPHSWHYHEPVDAHFGWHPSLALPYRHGMSYAANRPVFISQRQLREWAEALSFPLGGEVIYNPVRTLEPVAPVPHEGLVVGFLGCFEPRKNLPILLRAVEALRHEGHDIRLLLCGAQSDAEILALRAMTGLDESLLTIERHTNRVESFFSRIDVFVLPSLSETMPLVVTEALQSGVPVVMTTESGLGEILTEGRDLLTFRPDNLAELLQQLRKCLDSDFRRQLAESGRLRLIEADYTARFYRAIQLHFQSSTRHD